MRIFFVFIAGVGLAVTVADIVSALSTAPTLAVVAIPGNFSSHLLGARFVSSPTLEIKKRCSQKQASFFYSGGRTRTYGLQVMSLTSCQLLYPASLCKQYSIYMKKNVNSKNKEYRYL